MSWFASKTTAPARSTIRQQEVGILQRTMRDLQWSVPDETCLKTLQLPHYQLTLSIHVPQDYPTRPPVLRILTPAVHQWLDNQGFLSSCPAIQNWNPSSPSLVSLIQFVEMKFRESPPILQQQNYQPNQYQPPQSTPSQQPPLNPYQSSSNTNPYQPPTPTYSNNPYQIQPPPSQQQQQPQQQSPPQNNQPYNYNQYNQQQANPTQPQQPQRPSFSGYQQSPMNQSMSMSHSQSLHVSMSIQTPTHQQQQQQNQQSSFSPTNQQPQQQEPLINTLPLKSTRIPRPTAEDTKLPPEPPLLLLPIPTEPNFDRQQLSRLTIQQLEELDNDTEKIKLHVAQNPILSQMYENVITTQFEIDVLKEKVDKNTNPALKGQLDDVKKQVQDKEATMRTLKSQYEVILQKNDVKTFLTYLEEQKNKLEDEGDDLIAKFNSIRRPTDDEVANFLDEYELIRLKWHTRHLIIQRLNKNMSR